MSVGGEGVADHDEHDAEGLQKTDIGVAHGGECNAMLQRYDFLRSTR